MYIISILSAKKANDTNHRAEKIERKNLLSVALKWPRLKSLGRDRWIHGAPSLVTRTTMSQSHSRIFSDLEKDSWEAQHRRREREKSNNKSS